MRSNILKQLGEAKATVAAMVDGEVTDRYSISVRSALEAIAKAEELTPEHRAVLTTMAGMDVLKADMVVSLVIRNDPWQWPVEEMEVPLGETIEVPAGDMFPEKTVPIVVKAAERPQVAKAAPWPLDLAAASYDPDTGSYKRKERPWGADSER